MQFGINNALSEITLVLFTTLAPAGSVACAIVCVLLALPTLEERCRERVGQYLWIPVLVALVGLVASATHLGNPSNALYVLTGIGRSPLSNEIFFAVIAFGLVGSYWLTSFTRKRRPVLERAWAALGAAAALAFVASMAFAYDVKTIITWSLPTTPVALILNAFVAGPLIALVVFIAAERTFAQEFEDEHAAFPVLYNLGIGRALVIVSVVALVANTACYLAQGSLALSLGNSALSVADLVPHYYPCVAAFAVLAASGITLDCIPLFRFALSPKPAARKSAAKPPAAVEQTTSELMPPELTPVELMPPELSSSDLSPTQSVSPRQDNRIPLFRAIGAAALALAGIFIMRFVFYMMHLTAGISL